MGKLIYAMLTSLDGYVADTNGNFDWAEPSEEVHAYINDIQQNIGTFLLGRKMYQTLAVWDTIRGTDSPAMNQYAEIWRAASKVVYSASLTEASTTNTTIKHSFDPEVVKSQLAESDKDFCIGGPHLAAVALKAGIVDELHQFIAPIIVGDGTDWLPKELRLKLELNDSRQFDNGFVHLHFRR